MKTIESLNFWIFHVSWRKFLRFLLENQNFWIFRASWKIFTLHFLLYTWKLSKFLNFHISWNFFLCATIIIQKKDYRKFKFLNFPYIVKKIRLTFPSLASWKIFVLFPPLCTWKLSRTEIFEFSARREKYSSYISSSRIEINRIFGEERSARVSFVPRANWRRNRYCFAGAPYRKFRIGAFRWRERRGIKAWKREAAANPLRRIITRGKFTTFCLALPSGRWARANGGNPLTGPLCRCWHLAPAAALETGPWCYVCRETDRETLSLSLSLFFLPRFYATRARPEKKRKEKETDEGSPFLERRGKGETGTGREEKRRCRVKKLDLRCTCSTSDRMEDARICSSYYVT